MIHIEQVKQIDHALFMQAMGNALSPAMRIRVLHESATHTLCLHAMQEGIPIGFAIAQTRGSSAGLLLFFVMEEKRHQGVGIALLRALEECLSARGVKRLSLGHGGVNYVFPGLPSNCNAQPFFEKQGYVFTETCYDLVKRLTRPVHAPMVDGLSMILGNVKCKAEWVSVLKDEYPQWAPYYRTASVKSILIAIVNGRTVGGALLLGSNEIRLSGAFDESKIGGLGCLYVCESAREQGIGLQLAAQGTNQLHKNGIKISYLGWTWLREWYGRLGYVPYRTYVQGEKTL